jgi:hypothetical protein
MGMQLHPHPKVNNTIKTVRPILLLISDPFNRVTFTDISKVAFFIKHWVTHCRLASDDYSTMAHTLLPSPCMRVATIQTQRMMSAWTER